MLLMQIDSWVAAVKDIASIIRSMIRRNRRFVITSQDKAVLDK
jgi:hypothetical protein